MVSILKDIPELIPKLIKISSASYDKEADVLYVNLKEHRHADDSELGDDDIIRHYEKGEIIGVTILHASQRRKPAKAWKSTSPKGKRFTGRHSKRKK